MNRTQKIIVSIAAAGVGLVLAANPSNAMPWGDSLRPSFLAVGHDRVDDRAADDGADVSPDPTLPASAAEPTTTPVEPPATEPTTVTPVTPEPPTTTPATTVAVTEPPTTAAPATEPSTTPARPKAGEPTPEPPTGTDGAPSGEPTGDQPQEPEHPATTAPRTEVHTPATLALSCSLVAGERRANVACAWTGDTPDGAVRLLVLRGDGTVGRVRLNTEQLGVRSFLDTDAGAGKTFSFVVVFLDGNGKTIAHSNGVHLTTPDAPVTTEPPTTQPPTTQPPTSEPRHDEPTTAPA